MRHAAKVIALLGLLTSWESARADAFLYSNGTFKTINVPGAVIPDNTDANGINDSGQIVGGFNVNHDEGFLDQGGVVMTINVPNSNSTTAYGINNAGQIVGNFSMA